MANKRDTNIDIIRIFALFMVFLVHTFLNNGYYTTPLDTPVMIMGTYFRQFAMICVPLFLLITGYLHSGREIEFNKKYIMKLGKILIPYAIITTILYFVLNLYNALNGATFLTMLFGFKDNGYTWYIEMYIGLYLLIPFINKGYNRLKKEEKEGLIFVMLFLCFIPNLINIFGIYSQDYWTSLFIFAYYFVGMYLKEYGLNMKIHNKLFVLAISTAIHFIMGITLFRENMMHGYNGYNNIFCFINSVMVFDLLNSIDTTHLKAKTKKNLANLADAVLPAYMFSKITDIFVYQIFAYSLIPTVEQRILLMVPIILIAAFASITAGRIISGITNKTLSIGSKKQ